MLANSVTISSNGTDQIILGGNMRRRSLTVRYGGGGSVFVGIGKICTASSGDFIVQAAAPLHLTYEDYGDALTSEIHVFLSVGGQPITASETFTE